MTERLIKFSGTTKKKLYFSLSLFCSYTMPQLLRRVKSSQLLHKLYSNHSSAVVVLAAAAAASSLLYYYIHITHTRSAQALESLRKKGISKRKSLQKPEEKYASLKVCKLAIR
jgi:hypothetical protein